MMGTTAETSQQELPIEPCAHPVVDDEGRCKVCMPRKKKPRWKTESYSKRLKNRWDYYGGLCWLCGDIANTWDHVKPQSKGGSRYLPGNLRPACAPCNNAKGNLWPVPDFMVVVPNLRLTPPELIEDQRARLRSMAHTVAKLMMENESLKVKTVILKTKMDSMAEHDHCEWRIEVGKKQKLIDYYQQERLKSRKLP